MIRRFCAAVLVLFTVAAIAEDAPNLIGKTTEGWKLKNPKANYWKIGGDAKMNPEKNKELIVSGEPGEVPVLVNDLKDKQHGSDIYTEKEYGDVEIHLELMVPKGSNSGLYLMGKYEVQILDSYGKKNPGMGDLGAIYSAKTPTPETYEPKAPGEWQTFDIIFQAPRFDENGKKTANAKFVSIKLNGKEIQKDVEVVKATGGELSSKEAPKGPIMIQGDHGAVALRNLRVKELTAK